MKEYAIVKWPDGRDIPVMLPNARTLSRELHEIGDRKLEVSKRTSHMLMQFGQFLDHDITMAPEPGIHLKNKFLFE